VTVPTVERGFLLTDFCSMEMAGLSPPMNPPWCHLVEVAARKPGSTQRAALAQRIEGQRGLAAAAHPVRTTNLLPGWRR
jgi:hypothetical protein